MVEVVEEQIRLPEIRKMDLENPLYLGCYRGVNYFSGQLKVGDGMDSVSGDTRFERLWRLYRRLPDDLFLIAGYAMHLEKWYRDNRFCGRCGEEMKDSDSERARICEQCDHIVYPRLSPAVIVAVTRGERILLGRSSRFPKEMYSVLAGYVDPGEDLESTVSREIMEEANIRVKNIRYFGSQFWPFSDSLMIGFTAEYDGGEIMVDPEELEDARWFTKEEIPWVPDSLSISRQLIDWFVDSQG